RRLANLREAQGDGAGAAVLLRKALELQRAELNPNDPAIARALNDLGFLAANAGRLDEAEPLLQQAMAIYEAGVGLDHPDAAFAIDNLGNVKRALGEYDTARKLLHSALEIRR